MSSNEQLYKPAIPAKVRTVIYVTGLAVGFLSILANGIVAAVLPDQSITTLAITGTVGTAFGWLASATGTVYRPTASPPPSTTP